ncbi:metal-dependent hydrolase [Natronolimnohabitans sp. A-GB9]|uniref:metal-dependent hydrolase n=1 Tax=Natronolimnohabitans sp. A-GB9 TaxID=3069757 RepID=UPI0027AF7AC9|nr:metal-dependent hydrolase [Natronolimnohabitans sp. A-GB9]MDQ2051312.1 metal-dependent hydrolase [Natronolimnohabitans sp. A-GB9]
MYQVGHYGAALLTYAPLGTAVALTGNETTALVGALVCVALSTLPDCDHQLPFLEHRGPTHSFVFALLVGGGLAAVTAVFVDATSPLLGVGVVAFAFVVGTLSIVSHILADALTPMGVRPFWPLSSRHYTLEVTTAANPLANYALFGIGTAATIAGLSVVVLA